MYIRIINIKYILELVFFNRQRTRFIQRKIKVSRATIWRYLDYMERQELIFHTKIRARDSERWIYYYNITDKGKKMLSILNEYAKLIPLEVNKNA